jgi:hypothetical protein
MKNKRILITLALAAAWLGAVREQSQAQNVYSINVVGYCNVTMVPGWNLVANQLAPIEPYTSNANSVFADSSPADGSLLYRFNPATQSYYDAARYLTGFGRSGWYPPSLNTNDPVLNLPVGDGFFIWTRTDWVATFVGEVLQGTLINPLPANYSLKACMTPIDGALTSDLEFPPINGAQVFFFRKVTQRYTDAFTYRAPFGWTGPSGEGGRGGPTNYWGESFILHNPGPDTVWIRNFTVQFAGTAQVGTEGVRVAPSKISQIRLADKVVRLNVSKPKGTAYTVQFSSDRKNWTTVAANQTDTSWNEPRRAGARGFYRLVNP